MTRAEFLSSASKGQGRALQALRSGQYKASLHDLGKLVLRWTGYDLQMESSRGWYSVELMHASGYETELTDLLARFAGKTKGHRWNVSHREAIVEELARRGVSEAKSAIYRCYNPSYEFRYVDAILETDGLAGLDWVITHSQDKLVRDEDWRFKWWIEELSEQFGKNTVREWLKTEAASRPEIAEFFRLANRRRRRKQRLPDQLPMTYDQVREKWAGQTIRRTGLLQWSLHTTRAELENAWRAFEVEEDKNWLEALAHVFVHVLRRKSANLDFEKVLARARAWDDKRNPFSKALNDTIDPRVRQLGFDLFAQGWKPDGFDLIATNAVAGDEPFLMRTVRELTDSDDIHFIGMDLLRMSKDVDRRELLLWVHEETPCSFCRESSLRDLIEINAAPESMLRECLLDCSPDTRDLAEQALAETRKAY